MPQTITKIDRRNALIIVAAVPAAVALGCGAALGSGGEDAELRSLWVEYLAQLGRLHEAEAIAATAREPYDAEATPHMNGDDHERLWRKHKVDGPWRAMNREHRKLIRLTKAIRKAKAETLFGIGVKLSVSENFDEWDVVEANEDARRSLTALTRVDFIAATGSVMDEVQS